MRIGRREWKRGLAPFAGTARRVLRTNGACPLFHADELAAGPKRNFQVLDPLDFLAEFTQHIPPKGSHLIRYYGWYSNKSRGMRRKAADAAAANSPLLLGERPSANSPLLLGEGQGVRAALPPVSVPSRCSRTWAMLIKRVYEVDPLACPKCGGQMKVVAFIEPPQGAVIEKILRHCGLWRPSRAPPRSGGRRPPPVDFPSPESETGAGRDDWSDADWFYDLTEDFAQVGPDDSAYVDIDPFEAVF